MAATNTVSPTPPFGAPGSASESVIPADILSAPGPAIPPQLIPPGSPGRRPRFASPWSRADGTPWERVTTNSPGDAPAGAWEQSELPQPGRAAGTMAAMKASNPYPAAPGPDRARTVGHLASTVHGELQHVQQHVISAKEADSPDSAAFNLDHAAKHAASGLEHSEHLLSAMNDYHRPWPRPSARCRAIRMR